MVVALFLEASTNCSRCQQPIALNGASESVLCGSCQAPLPTPPDLWQNILGDELGEITGMQEKEGRTSTKMMGERTVRMKYGRLAPRCVKCKAPFPEADIQNGRTTGRAFCAGCGTEAAVRPAPAWLTALQPLATTLVGESMASAAAAPDARKGPVSIHCIQCGAPTQIDGKERLLQCKHCGGQIYLPDDLWQRLHPADTVTGWFVVLELGGAVGVLTGDGANGVDRLRAMALDPSGNVIMAYEAESKGDAGHESRIACFDRRGLMLWLQDGVEFNDHVSLVPSPLDGNLLLVDVQERTGRWIRSQDGQPLRTIGNRGAAAESDSARAPDHALFDGHENQGVAIDYDGTILVLRDWGGDDPRSLRRFAPDGSPVPLWPVRPARLPGSYPGWDSIPSAPQAAPDSSTRVAIGWDGCTYFVGRRSIAKLARDGRHLGTVTFPENVMNGIAGFGADRSGIAYILFRHEQPIGSDQYNHVMRVMPDGSFAVWLGPHVFASPSFVGKYDGKMFVGPDGTIALANDERVRIIAATGTTVWESAEAARARKREIEEIARARLPKRAARDLEG